MSHSDRILYHGRQLDLAVYSRSELKGSDHKPGKSFERLFNLKILSSTAVFAIFRAEVRVIDAIKKATLSRLLLESVISTDPGEKLDEKLAALILPSDTGDCKCSVVRII